MRGRVHFLTPAVGRVLRQLRQRSGLSQTEVARRLGWRAPGGVVRVCELERGKRPDPSARILVRYLQACGVRQQEFFQIFDRALELDVLPEVRRAVAPVRAAGGFVKSEQQLARKTARAVHRYQDRTAFLPEPHAPDQRERKRRARHFSRHRACTGIVDEAVERRLMHMNVHPVDHLKYLALAHLTLSRLLPTGKVKGRGRLNRADYARAQGLDPEVAKAVRAVVRRLARNWERPGAEGDGARGE